MIVRRDFEILSVNKMNRGTVEAEIVVVSIIIIVVVVVVVVVVVLTVATTVGAMIGARVDRPLFISFEFYSCRKITQIDIPALF